MPRYDPRDRFFQKAKKEGLRARYGGLLRTLEGLLMLAAEIVSPRSFPGRRRGLARSGLAFLLRWPYFALTPVRANGSFRPQFSGWGYELRREGAFVELGSRRERPRATRPRVSILIRTVDRGAWLREALQSCVNQTYDNAANALKAAGLNSVREDQFSDTVAAGNVVSTSPGAGQQVPKGGNVKVTVSKGPDLVPVPNVVGMSVAQATTTIQQAGLTVANVFGFSDKKVFASDPSAGAQVKRGSSVNLYTR